MTRALATAPLLLAALAGCSPPPPPRSTPREPEVVLHVWHENKKPFLNLVQYSLRFDDPDPRCRWTCEGTSREGRIRCPWPNDCNKAAVDAEVRVLANWLHCSYFFNFETYVRPSWLNGEFHPLNATIPCFGGRGDE